MRRYSVAATCAALALFAAMVTATQVAPPAQPGEQAAATAQEAVQAQAAAPRPQSSVTGPGAITSAPMLQGHAGARDGYGRMDPQLQQAPPAQAYLTAPALLGDAAGLIGTAEPVPAASSTGPHDGAQESEEGPEEGATEPAEPDQQPDPMPHQPVPLDGQPPPPPAPEPAQAEPTRAELDDAEAGVLGTEVGDGEGTLSVLSGSQQAPQPDADRVIEVRIEVEDGLPVDDEAFGAFVMETLNDDRGWAAVEQVSFARTEDSAEFRVVLATPQTVDELCAPLDTAGVYSCGRNGHAVLNALRWVEGAEPYLEAGGELQSYRRYLVNHEVGHLLGHQHQGCPGEGEPAPIMLQQSMGLDGCEPTAWVQE